MMSVGVRVRGRVHGVGFRWYTRAAAEAAGVSGWVRNLDDGSVEAQLQGADAAVQAVLEALRDGPPGARVDDVEVWPIPTTVESAAVGSAFEIRPTSPASRR